MNTRPQRLDCLIVGGGPAGLTGALYLARFRRNVAVVDAGKSRAASIPRSHNHPGFPNGIAGKSLLQTLRKQAEEYGAKIIAGDVSSLAWTDDCFEAQSTAGVFCASRILLATGITDKAPTIMSENPAYVQEHVRYCPVCDGFEARGLRIAVCGHPKDADPKAEFLRVYSGSVNVVPCVHETDATFAVTSQGIEVTNQNGETARFDLLYPAMGCDVHSELATALGAKCNEVGCLIVDNKQQTTFKGIYAAGDVVSDLHHLVVAEAHAAIAATAIHNDLPLNLAADEPL